MVCAIRSGAVSFYHKCGYAVSSCKRKISKLGRKIKGAVSSAFENLRVVHGKARRIVPESLSRKTTGEKHTVWFPKNCEEEKQVRLLESFAGYDLTAERYYSSSPLSDEEKQKMEDMIARGDKRAGAMRRLIRRCENKKFSRAKFDGLDHLAMERVTFELVKEFMVDLNELYNEGLIDSLADDLEEKFHFNYYDAVIGEILARSIAYISRLDGKTIQLPVYSEDGFQLLDFTIRLYRMGDDLPCYILECKDNDGVDLATPWFVVRGTDTSWAKKPNGRKVKSGSFESMVADVIHSKGVAEGVVEYSMANTRVLRDGRIQPSLTDVFRNRQFNLAGHSLGGNIVNQLTAYFYDSVQQAFAFGSPGVSDEKGVLWEAKVESDAEEKLFNFQTEGDFVPAAGKRLIGTHFAVTPLLRPRDANAIQNHLFMVLMKPFELQLIDLDLEERKVGRRAVEKSRGAIGAVFRKVMSKTKKKMPDWYTHNELFRLRAKLLHMPCL